MNDQELNEKIAVKRGWVKKHTKKAGTWFELWDEIKLLHVMEYPPDYCNSWLWAGELLEELVKNGMHFSFDLTRKLYNVNGELSISPTRAIAEAWDSVNQ